MNFRYHGFPFLQSASVLYVQIPTFLVFLFFVYNLLLIECNFLDSQSEYVSARDKRRAFVSGFTGSAGEFNFSISPALSLLQENQSLYADQIRCLMGDLVDWTFKYLNRLAFEFLSRLWTIALPWQNCHVQYDRICGEIKFYSMLIIQLLHRFMEVII